MKFELGKGIFYSFIRSYWLISVQYHRNLYLTAFGGERMHFLGEIFRAWKRNRFNLTHVALVGAV